MNKNPEVERWFSEMKPPAETAMRRVREIILRADPRMTEYVRWRTVIFARDGDFASFVQYTQPQVNVMFHRGARIPGNFPHVTGTHPSARWMRFNDVSEVEARAAELTAVGQAWCALVTTEGDRAAAPAPKAKKSATKPKKPVARARKPPAKATKPTATAKKPTATATKPAAKTRKPAKKVKRRR